MIKKKEFDELKCQYKKKYNECERLEADNLTYRHQITSLRDEIKRLGELISANVDDCRIGAWCKDCKHHGYENAQYKSYSKLYEGQSACWVSNQIDGEVWFCKKHLHEICPEFEAKSE